MLIIYHVELQSSEKWLLKVFTNFSSSRDLKVERLQEMRGERDEERQATKVNSLILGILLSRPLSHQGTPSSFEF